MTTNDETAREKRYQLESQLMTIIEAYTGDRLHEDDTYSKLENALVNFIEQHEAQAVLAARINSLLHLEHWAKLHDLDAAQILDGIEHMIISELQSPEQRHLEFPERLAALQQASQKGTQE